MFSKSFPDLVSGLIPRIFAHHRHPVFLQFAPRFWQLHPTATAAVAAFIRKCPRLGQRGDSHQRDVQAAFLVPGEALAHDFLFPHMQWLQRGDFFPVGHTPDAVELPMKPDVHIFPLLILWHGDFGSIRRRPAELFTLIVKTGGEKPEVIVLKMEPAPALVDAALAQDDGLHALAEGLANEGPFLETDGWRYFCHLSYLMTSLDDLFNFHLPLSRFRVTFPTPKQNGGRSSTVELQIVVLDVAGSSPVDHPTFLRRRALHGSFMEPLESRIQYVFRQPALLDEALSHPSLRYEKRKNIPDNQRLEFLGDAVLQLVLSDAIYHRLPNADEGLLTKLRTRLVSEKPLASLARKLQLVDYIKLGRGEAANKGRERESIQADAMEALIGAIYVDGGWEAARAFVLRVVEADLQMILASPEEMNPKGELQELLQATGGVGPEYHIVDAHGPDHEKQYAAAVLWNGRELGRGQGTSKKDAQIQAAAMALKGAPLNSLLKEFGSSTVVSARPPEKV